VIEKPLKDISKIDIESLIRDAVCEKRTIEYKAMLPGNSDDDKREFLADVSSFANAGGGDLVLGVIAEDGIPKEATGCECTLDAEKLRLENIIRDGLEPRVLGIQIQNVDGFAKGPVLIIRIPKSWTSPHMVKYKNLSRFYTRNSAGKYQMDVSEIRAAITLSESLTDKIKRFRDDRVAKIIADEVPLSLNPGAKIILHMIPLVSFSQGFKIDITGLDEQVGMLRPPGAAGWNSRFNIDGFVTFSGYTGVGDLSVSYCQVFRTGQIEAVYADFVRDIKGKPYIASVAYEKYILESVKQYLQFLQSINIACPIVISISIIGAKGAHMYVSPRYFSGDADFPIDREHFLLPDAIIDDYNSDISELLRPIFDVVWNACGYPRSINYKNGKWDPK
jgi:hypothetical protein